MKGIFSRLPGGMSANEFYVSPTYYTIPTLQDVKDALRTVKESREDLIRMIGVIDIVSLAYSRRLLSGEGQTIGFRKFLQGDGYLISRYSTLRRYKKLAEMIRMAGDLDPLDKNLLYAIEPCPPAFDEFDKEFHYDPVREFFDKLHGSTYKELYEEVQKMIKQKGE